MLAQSLPNGATIPDPSSTMQVVNVLIKANKDFDWLVIPQAGTWQRRAVWRAQAVCER